MVDTSRVWGNVVGRREAWLAYGRATPVAAVGVVVSYWLFVAVGAATVVSTFPPVVIAAAGVVWLSYEHAGVVPPVAFLWVVGLWSYVFPPAQAVLVGAETVPWYRMPSPSVVAGVPPGAALWEATVVGVVVSTVAVIPLAVVCHTVGTAVYVAVRSSAS